MAHPQLNITTLDFHYGEASNGLVIDIPRCLSLYNRRSYRSGYVYSVDYIEFIGLAGEQISVSILPATYSLLAAYEMGFETWLEQRSETIADTGIEPGRWSDFKPWYSFEHLDQSWPELLPRGMGSGLTLQSLSSTGSEWNRAEIIRNDLATATTTTINVGMLGADNLPYGSLMNAYGDTRAATMSPDPLMPGVASSSWITRAGEASGEMTNKVIELIEEENDLPPYANQADTSLPPIYVGGDQSAPRGILLDRSVSGATGRSVNLNGGLVPLGLLVISTDSQEFTLRVHMTRGTYKGVAAKSMGSFR